MENSRPVTVTCQATRHSGAIHRIERQGFLHNDDTGDAWGAYRIRMIASSTVMPGSDSATHGSVRAMSSSHLKNAGALGKTFWWGLKKRLKFEKARNLTLPGRSSHNETSWLERPGPPIILLKPFAAAVSR